MVSQSIHPERLIGNAHLQVSVEEPAGGLEVLP